MAGCLKNMIMKKKENEILSVLNSVLKGHYTKLVGETDDCYMVIREGTNEPIALKKSFVGM